MRIFKALLLLFIVSACLPASVFAQRDSIPLTTIVTKTQQYAEQRPLEKVYLHFDKPYYGLADTIWFKAYVTYGLHQPSQLSKVVYVDMLNSRDSVVASLKLPINNGVAYGNITLPALTFKEGNYHVFAYTKWMRNFEPTYFFNKTIPVGSNAEGLVLPQISFANKVTDASALINATVTYKDQNGAPYADKKVSWEAMLDDQSLAKGKGITDKNGRVVITYASTKLSNLSAGTIETTVDVGSKKNFDRTFPVSLSDQTDDIQFFPEGGELLSGVRTRIAFKAIKPSGLGVDVKGTIIDNSGSTVMEFNSSHLGMGVFVLAPESGKSYKANVTFADGTKGTYYIPRIRAAGVSLSLDNADAANIGIKISTNQAYLDKNKGQTIYIVGQSNQVICFAAKTTLQDLIYGANIPKTKFPTGISQFTLFTSKGDPLSERIIFIDHGDQLTTTVTSDKKIYGARQMAKMTLLAKEKAAPVEGSFSVTVLDETKVPKNDDDETTILSSLLLTSDLRGFIEQPNYYFNHTDDAAKANLDILMMTQGYRRFSYKNIIADKMPPLNSLPEQGIGVSGTLRLTTGIPVFKGNVRLIIPDRNFSTETVTNADGNFIFDKLYFRDSTEVTVTSRGNTNNRNMVLTLVNDAPVTLIKNPSAPNELPNIDSTLSAYLQNSKRQYANSQILKEVVIKDTKVVKKASHNDYPSLAGLSMMADEVITADRLKGCNFILMCLQGARLTLADNQLYITRNYNSGNKTPVQIIYNGMQVDENFTASLKADDIDNVEVFTNDGVSGINKMSNTAGVVVINGKKKPKAPEGDKMSVDQLQDFLVSQQNTVKAKPRGFDFGREFYSPKYEAGKQSAVGIDVRTTVYWNPNVITNKATGSASFNFFTPDGRGSYRAIVEGFDADGNLGRYIYRFNVQ